MGLIQGGRVYGTYECFVFRFERAAGAWRTEVYSPRSQPQAPLRAAAAAAAAKEEETQCSHWDNYHEALRKCEAVACTASPTALVFCDQAGIVVGIDGPAIFIDQ